MKYGAILNKKDLSWYCQINQILAEGKAKTAKQHLKHLHTSIQKLSQMDEANTESNANDTMPMNESVKQATTGDTTTTKQNIDSFRWMAKEEMIVLVYLVTVSQSMQTGCMKRALRNAEKAISPIEKMKSTPTLSPNHSILLNIFHFCALEHSVVCHLVVGEKEAALTKLGCLYRLFTDVASGVAVVRVSCASYAQKIFI